MKKITCAMQNAIKNQKSKITSCLLAFFFCLPVISQPLERISMELSGLDPRQMLYADSVIMQAIADNEMPGAVLAVIHKGKMAYLRAYGYRQIYPSRLPMEVNTVFDLASVSKSVATAISTMILVERGKLRLTDRVSMYIPNFRGNIRIIDLLTHRSGLPSYASVAALSQEFDLPNPDALIEYIATVDRLFDPGERVQYGCLNFITLQRIIETVSGQKLEDFAQKNIFDVLGMKSTGFRPEGEVLARTAPTERQADGSVLHGVVHDPLARLVNDGNSGNAGLFSDADDLAILAVALLNGGTYNGKRLMSPLGVQTMTSISPLMMQSGRTPGWDASSFIRSDLLSERTFGHTGYTGTSMVIDPENDIAIILLSNRVHPTDDGNLARVRAVVANIVAAAIIRSN